MPEPGTMHSFASGAKSSEVKPDYSLMPLEALRRIAARFRLGADHYGRDNWRLALSGVDGDGFLADRLNHAIEHLMLYANGDRSDDHLGAAACNLSMLLTASELSAQAAQAAPPVNRAGTCRRCGHPDHRHGPGDMYCNYPVGDTTPVPCGCPTFTPLTAP